MRPSLREESNATASPATAPAVRIRLFGSLEAEVGGTALPPLRSRKGGWLLALLALRGGREVPREWLQATLWPDSPDAQAAASLRQSLADLRRALGPAASRLASPTTRTLRFDVGPSEVDVLAFDEALARGDRPSLERAVELHRAPLLEGCLEEWVAAERDPRHLAAIDALERLARWAAERGETAVAIAHLRRLVAADPFREAAHRALLEALAEEGDFPAAALAYRELRELLHRELNASPDPETVALFERLRTAARQRASGAPAPGQPARPRRAPVRRMPRPLTEIIGRENDAEAVAGALARSRLVTLTGTGGVGKTRLAIHTGERVADDYPDGVWFVDLGSLASDALVEAAIAAAVGVAEESDRPWAGALAEAMRPRCGLLILDNCEHVVSACGRVATRLLEECPCLRVLATSRQALGVVGEAVYHVQPLSVPPSDSGEVLPESVLQYDGARLFVERARLLRSDFRVTLREAAAVAQVCRQLDGIPLAIELAAARVRAMPVSEIAAHLDDRFRLLTQGNRAAASRHQTLRAAMDWSHGLLTEQERLLLRRLAVFSGGWTLRSAEKVCADPDGTPGGIGAGDVLDLLTNLVDKSLVVFEPRDDGDRYSLLETVRQYARERLEESGELRVLRDRHAEHFVALAHDGMRQDEDDQNAWCVQVEPEHDNLRLALDWLEESGRWDAVLSLGGALTLFWMNRGHRMEGRARLERALARPEAAERTRGRAAALLHVATLAWGQGDHDATAHYAAEGLQIARELESPRMVAWGEMIAGHAFLGNGDVDAAVASYRSSLEGFREAKDEARVASLLICLGEAARHGGRIEEARELYEEACATAKREGATVLEAVGLGNLSQIAFGAGDIERSRQLASAALWGVWEGGSAWLTPLMMPNLAQVALADGDPERAARILGAVDGLCEASSTAIQKADRALYERCVEWARERCGPERFAAAWAEGRALSVDDAVRYALEPAGERGEPAAS